MYDENNTFKMEELSTPDKVRNIVLNNFSSNLFLLIAIFYSITYVVGIFGVIAKLESAIDILGLIIPILMLVGIWKTYSMSNNGNQIDTGGLRIIRGVMTFFLILVGILVGLLLLISLVGGLAIFILTIPLGVVMYVFFVFRMILTNIISSLEAGDNTTTYYTRTMVFFSIAAIISCLTIIFLLSVDLNTFIQRFPLPDGLPDGFELPVISNFTLITSIINMVISATSSFLIVKFVSNLKKDLENIHVIFPDENIEYKISQKTIDIDAEIDDKRNYDI